MLETLGIVKGMVKRILIAVITASLVACGDVSSPEVNQSTDLHLVESTELAGKWVVVNYWAEWCKPCREEIPELNELYHAHKNTGVIVVGINFDDPEWPELKKQANALGVRYPMASPKLSKQLGLAMPEVLPTTYILNPKGIVKHTLVGPQTGDSIGELIGGDE